MAFSLLFLNLITFLARAALVIILAQITWQIVDQYLPEVSMTTRAFTPPIIAESSPSDWRWADQQPIVAPRTTTAPQEISEIRNLNATLIGIMGGGKNAVAILQLRRGKKIFAVGETVQGNIVLAEVLQDRIILEENGAFKSLSLQKPESAIVLYADLEEKTAENRAIASAVIGSATSGGLSSSAMNTLDNLSANERNSLQNIKQLLRSEPVKVANMVRFSQVSEDGQLKGMRIRPRANQALFQSLGFANDDVILAVNGTRMADLFTQPATWGKLLNADTYIIEVERDGARRTVNINW